MSRVNYGTVYALVLLLPTAGCLLRPAILDHPEVLRDGDRETLDPPVRPHLRARASYALGAFIALFLAFIIALYLTILAGCFVQELGHRLHTSRSRTSAKPSCGAASPSWTPPAWRWSSAPIAGILGMAAAYILVRKKSSGQADARIPDPGSLRDSGHPDRHQLHPGVQQGSLRPRGDGSHPRHRLRDPRAALRARERFVHAEAGGSGDRGSRRRPRARARRRSSARSRCR
ncbi:MAG: hypothetical protein MZU95_08695 [Desulfomicrobium escambiense]|nr:hypothetical protein [Desulfomicrobium escambiense]